MTSRAKDLASRRANFMGLETPGEDRFTRAAKIQEQVPSGTAPRVPPIQTRPAAEAGEGNSESLTLIANLTDVIENPLNARHCFHAVMPVLVDARDQHSATRCIRMSGEIWTALKKT